MDPFSQLGAVGPMSGLSGGAFPMGGFPALGGAAGTRASGCCQQGGQSADPTMAMLMQISMMQMLQLLLALMMGQKGGQGAKGGGNPLAQAAGLGGSGKSGGGVSSPAVNSSDQGEIKGFIREAAGAYGADANVLTEIARRESSFDTDVQNNWDSNAKKGTPSKGLFQFIEPTFNSMAPKAKAANPAAWKGMGAFNWNDWRQQALVAAWAIANGQGSHWATYKAAGGR